MGRAILVLVLLGWVAVVWAIRRRRLVEAQQVAAGERLPAELRTRSRRTWVLITSPLCAPCGPIAERLRKQDSGAQLTIIDASEDPGLAQRLRARAAPTLILADRDGYVRERSVGPEAVNQFLESTSALASSAR